MPNTKNAFTRIKILDELLSDRLHYYDMNDLTIRCNERLISYGYEEVTVRCIQLDIKYLERDPISADIERFRHNGKQCLKYSDPSFSVFNKKLSKEEENLLQEVFNTIGQFNGLEHFEWIDRIKCGLELEERQKIICFSNNPYLQNSSLLGELFDYTSNQVVIKLEYHSFHDPQSRPIILHPYLLKQYNDRWYIIGYDSENDTILNLALDRIEKVTPMPTTTIIPCKINLEERFEDIVGVTFFEGSEIEHITFWASDHSKDYVATKPIHGSQTLLKKDTENNLRAEYPHLKGGAFFSIDCIENYELIRELCSFGKELLVLEPSSIQEKVFKQVKEMYENYKNLRT